MYNYNKPQVKIADGAVMADYKSLIQRALATPACEQQSLFGSEKYENDTVNEISVKYVF